MNSSVNPNITAPRHALLAPQQPLHREPPPLWTSSLTSKPLWSGDPADLPRRQDARTPPLFPVLAAMLGTWNPGRHPIMRMRRQQPMHREATRSPPPAAIAACEEKGVDVDLRRHDGGGVGHDDAAAPMGHERAPACIAPPQNPIRCETPATGPLRNGNPRGNPNLAPAAAPKPALVALAKAPR